MTGVRTCARPIWLTGTNTPTVKEEPKTETSSKPQGGRGKNSRHGERRERSQGDRNNRNRRGERRHGAVEGKSDETQAPRGRRQQSQQHEEIGRASCRERVCQYV